MTKQARGFDCLRARIFDFFAQALNLKRTREQVSEEVLIAGSTHHISGDKQFSETTLKS